MAVPPTPSALDTIADKAALRRGMRAARRAFVNELAVGECATLEAALVRVLGKHLPPGIVAGYHAVGSEIGLGDMARVALWPRVVPGGPLTFHREAPCQPLPVAGLGAVLQPAAGAPSGEPDIILVPLLAVTRYGVRLGQGGGHYDRTLAALRARRDVLAVGIAWDMQLVDALPADPWDATLDALATPLGWRDSTRAQLLTFGVRSPKSPR